MRRASFRQRGYGTAWDKLSRAFRAANPLCKRCAERGRVVASAVTDHILPKAKGGTDDWSNLMALCTTCHNSAKQSEEKRGSPRIDPNNPWKSNS